MNSVPNGCSPIFACTPASLLSWRSSPHLHLRRRRLALAPSSKATPAMAPARRPQPWLQQGNPELWRQQGDPRLQPELLQQGDPSHGSSKAIRAMAPARRPELLGPALTDTENCCLWAWWNLGWCSFFGGWCDGDAWDFADVLVDGAYRRCCCI